MKCVTVVIYCPNNELVIFDTIGLPTHLNPVKWWLIFSNFVTYNKYASSDFSFRNDVSSHTSQYSNRCANIQIVKMNFIQTKDSMRKLLEIWLLSLKWKWIPKAFQCIFYFFLWMNQTRVMQNALANWTNNSLLLQSSESPNCLLFWYHYDSIQQRKNRTIWSVVIRP